MKAPGVVALLPLFLLAIYPGDILRGSAEDKELGSFVFTPVAADAANNIRLEGKPYLAQAGDLVLFDDHCKFILAIYRLCGTSGPMHAGIVIRRPDGSLGILEAGPNMVSQVFIFDLLARLHSYNGTVLVRRLKTPLGPEQAEKLTQFSQAQEGKSYSWMRLLMQGTPARPRGPFRKWCFGKTCLDRDRWTCGELTAAAATTAGILDPKVHFANAMYPRDFAYDEEFDLRPFYHPAELWYPRPELKWVGNGVETGYPGPNKPLPK